MEKKSVLAIDPGSRKMGYALIHFKGKIFTYITSGVLDYSKITSYLDRLPVIYQELTGIIRKFSPDEMALEALIYIKNPTSLIKLSHARGAAIAAFSQRPKERIFEYSPNLVKTTITGHGHATKEKVKQSVSILLGVKDYTTDDESDALAIAICHVLHRNQYARFLHEKFSKPGKILSRNPKKTLAQQLASAIMREKGRDH